MRRENAWTMGLAVLLIASWLGCSSDTKKGQPQPGEKAAKAGPSASEGKTAPPAKPPVVEPPPVPTIPKVSLTEALAATCVVKVGDTLPEATLPNLGGKAIELRSLRGEKLTVVCFWKADNLYSVEELRELAKDVAGPYAAKGVRIVAIDEGDTPQAAGEKFQSTGATFACLLDPDGAYFKRVATEKLPRTYLVDAQGKILWFDIEYSQSTQRDLVQAIDVALGGK
jgi:peroxiredoxin